MEELVDLQERKSDLLIEPLCCQKPKRLLSVYKFPILGIPNKNNGKTDWLKLK